MSKTQRDSSSVIRICFVILLVFRFARFSRRSGATLWLPSTAWRFGFWFWNGANGHAQKKFRLTRFLFAGSNALQEFSFGNRVIGFRVIRTDARSSPD